MELPPTAASRVCGLLSGLDLLSLSHASGFWLRTLDQSPVWESRLPPQPSPLHAAGYKAVYLRSRALGFAGNRRSDISRSDTSYALLHQVSGEKLQLSGLRDTSYSFDVCFALLPEEPDNCYIGGVLYGLQSQQAESRVWPRFHQQFVLVSSARDLYCSVIDHRPVVKSDLQLKKWYHVALTYDHRNRRQEVYVDGVKVRSDSGELHHEMEFLTHEQVGTGCITANGLDFPKPEYLGWYGFHGLVDDFRVWDGVLSEQEVGRLSTGKGGGERSLLGSLKGSGRPPRRLRWNVCEIQCTRPVETRQLEMKKNSSRRRIAIVRPEQLPTDTVKLMCSYLTGFDAFNLSHTSFWWMQYLRGGAIWQRCLSASAAMATQDQEQSVSSSKEQYMLSRSMLFRGLQGEGDGGVDSYAYFADARRDQRRPSRFRLNFLGSESFSFDVWFSLLSAGEGRTFGGIIYGFQSASRESRQWPHYHQQFVLVSSTGELYCSVLDSRPIVRSNLKANRWYHLALTYDNDHQSQDVYLDGEKIHSSTGALHHEWGFLTHEQVGTGCITAGKLNFPRPKYLGWYGFHGVIDNFRVWSGAMSQDDIIKLSHDGSLEPERLRASVRNGSTDERVVRPLVTWVNVQLTMCTRPAEGKSMQLVKYRSSSQPNCVIS